MHSITAMLNQIIGNPLVEAPTRLAAFDLVFKFYGLMWPRGLYHGLTR